MFLNVCSYVRVCACIRYVHACVCGVCECVRVCVCVPVYV